MRRLSRYLLVIPVLLLLANCNRGTYPIGFVGTLTGINAELGVAVRNGALLAVEELNAEGGIDGLQVELHIRDDRSSVQRGIFLAEQLVDRQDVAVIVGFLTSSMAEAAVATAAAYPDRLVISPTISGAVGYRVDGTDSGDASESQPRPGRFVQLVGSPRIQGERLAEYAYAAGGRRAVWVTDVVNRKYSQAVAEGFVDRFRRLGGTVAAGIEHDQDSDPDYAAAAAQLVSQEYDVLMSALSAPSTAALVQMLRIRSDGSHSPKVHVAGMWAFTPELMRQGGRDAEGIVLASAVNPDPDNPRYAAFAEAYRGRYNQDPAFGAVLGYEAVLRAARPDAAAAAARGYSLFQVKDGQFVSLQE